MWNVEIHIPISIPEFWNVECGMWISTSHIPHSKILELELESRFDTGCCLQRTGNTEIFKLSEMGYICVSVQYLHSLFQFNLMFQLVWACPRIT